MHGRGRGGCGRTDSGVGGRGRGRGGGRGGRRPGPRTPLPVLVGTEGGAGNVMHLGTVVRSLVGSGVIRDSHLDRLPRYLIVLDFEATCEKDAKEHEIIEFPSVVLDTTTREVVARFECFVKPTKNPRVTAFCYELTSITQEQVDAGVSFPEALQRHYTFLTPFMGEGVFVTCGDWDLKTMLPSDAALNGVEVPPFYKSWVNIKPHFQAMYQLDRCPGMDKMLSLVGLPLLGTHHRGIDDCVNIAALASKMMADGWL